MAAEEELPEVLWLPGQRGADQTCDEICLAASQESGATTDECVSDHLQAYWLDSSCGFATTARADADQAPWTSCVVCGPNDYSNVYCLPGVIDSSPELAYTGVSVTPSSQPTCGVAYTDDRVLPLCPCAVVPPGGVGWTITTLILVGCSAYVVLGVLYGRYSRATPAEKNENGFLSTIMTAATDSRSTIVPSAHPHFNLWLDLPGLMSDGFDFFLIAVGLRRPANKRTYLPTAIVGIRNLCSAQL